MALLHCDFKSEVLDIAVSMDVILPQRPGHDQGFPVLLLLHGLSDDHTIWQRRTAIERYVEGRALAVVMPAVNRSFYTDMVHGDAYWSFISEELPTLARTFFSLSDRREDNFVAGLSMGGYGAFKLALRQPHRFAAAASLSGVVDIAARVQEATGERARLYRQVFADPQYIAGSDDDLLHLATTVSAGTGRVPALYQWCGTEDTLYDGNLRFRDHARACGLSLDYCEGPGGHTWDCWDAQIEKVLDWLPWSPPSQSATA